MRSINKVILIGNIARDPEMRQTPSGQVVTTFVIATNREWITKDGKKHTLAEYHEVVAWAKLAEICHQYLKKGKLVYIEGYLKTRSWDTPEGTKRFKTEIVVQDMIMLDKRPANVAPDYIPEEDDATFVETGDQAPKAPERKPKVTESRPTMTVTPEASAPVAVAPGLGIDDDLGL